MDRVYSEMGDEDADQCVKNVLVDEIKRISEIPHIKSDIVIPVSCIWYERARNLEEAIGSDVDKCRSLAEGSLLLSQKTKVAVSDLTSSQLVKHLENDSGVPALKQRYVRICMYWCIYK